MGGWTLVQWAVFLGDVQGLQEPKGPTTVCCQAWVVTDKPTRFESSEATTDQAVFLGTVSGDVNRSCALSSEKLPASVTTLALVTE